MKSKLAPFLRVRNAIIGLLFIALLAVAGYYFMQYQRLSAQTANAKPKAQIESILNDIEKVLYVSDRTGAQAAEITDITKLKNQPFFANAKNGDYLVLLPVAKKAVLYRPSDKKVIEVGPFDPSSVAGSASSTPSR